MQWLTGLAVSINFVLSTATLLEPDFQSSPEQKQVFREELAIALTKTPGASPETRKKLKKEAEELLLSLFRKGQDNYKLERANLTVSWDFRKPCQVAEGISIPNWYHIRLNEILFFTYPEAHINSVFPHEITHFLQDQRYGNPDRFHSLIFHDVVEFLSSGYTFRKLDLDPARRLAIRMYPGVDVVGADEDCERQ